MQSYEAVKVFRTSSTIDASITTRCGYCGTGVPMPHVAIAVQNGDEYEAGSGVQFVQIHGDKSVPCPDCGLMNGLSLLLVDQVRDEALRRLRAGGSLEWELCERCGAQKVQAGSILICPSCVVVSESPS